MAGITAAIATALGGGAVATAFAGFAVRLVAGAAISFLAKSQRPKPKAFEQRSAGALVNGTDPVAPHDIVYGTVRKGGTVTFRAASGADNRYHHMVIALAGHEVAAIDDIYINDKVVALNASGVVTSAPWNGKIRIKKHLGSLDQQADPDLVAETGVSASFRGRGIAYLYVRLEHDQNVFPGGIPLITAVVRGRKVFDPGTGLTEHSNNAALCLSDYLKSDFGFADTPIADVDLQVSANISAEAVPLAAGGTQARYTIDGVIRSDERFGDVLGDLITACAGQLWWGQGAWRLKVGHHTPPVTTLTLDDMRGPISIKPRASLGDNFSAVGGTFVDENQDWITTDYPRVSSEVFLAEDGGNLQVLDFELPFTTNAARAQRLARLALYRAREQIVFSARIGLRGLRLQVGDVVAVTFEEYGWIEKQFEIDEFAIRVDTRSGTLEAEATFRETSAAAHDWNADERAILQNNTQLLAFNDTPSVGVEVRPETRISRERVASVFVVNVTSSAPSFVDKVEVQFRAAGAASYRSAGFGELGEFQIGDVEPGFYDIRARAINGFNVQGEWTTVLGVQAAEDTTPPQTPHGFAASVLGASVHLQWVASTEADLSYYRVRHSSAVSGATWRDAVTIQDKVPRPTTGVSVPLLPGTYMIRAYDKSGLVSEGYASAVVPQSAMEAFANEQRQVEDPAFSGAKSGSLVNGDGALQIADPSAAASVAEYEFAGVVDTGAVRRCFVRHEITVARLDLSAALFDDLPGLFDGLPGLFDNVTGIAEFADCDVDFLVSATNDDPGGAAVWSDYALMTAGYLSGRAFRFKAILKSTSNNVTPAVTNLEAIVEYN